MPPQNRNQKHPHGRKNSGPREDQRGYSTSEAVIALKDELVEEIQTNREQKPEKDTAHRVVEYVTLFFVILTTVGIGIQDFILHSSDGTFKETLLSQKKSSEQQLKAYVGVVQHGIENFGTPEQVLKATRKNYGVTPAIDVFMGPPNIAMIKIPKSSTPQFNPVFCNQWPAIKNTFTLFPQEEADFFMRGNPLSPAQIEQVKKDSSFVLLYWGAIYYRDIFGRQLCSRYCWAFKGPEMTEKTAELCLQHNDFHDVSEEQEAAKRAAE